jgi:hypothetical protein
MLGLLCAGMRQPAGRGVIGVVFGVVQRRTRSHLDLGRAGATTDTFILFENGVGRNRPVLLGLSNAADRMPFNPSSSRQEAGKRPKPWPEPD